MDFVTEVRDLAVSCLVIPLVVAVVSALTIHNLIWQPASYPTNTRSP